LEQWRRYVWFDSRSQSISLPERKRDPFRLTGTEEPGRGDCEAHALLCSCCGPARPSRAGPPCLRFFPSLRGKRIALILEWQLLSLAFF
jgi:hypothetical protein